MVSSPAGGTAKASAAMSAAATARSASENDDAMTPMRGDVARSNTGTTHTPERHPARASIVAAAAATSPA